MKIFVLILLLSLCALIMLFGCSINTYKTGDISKNPAAGRMKFKNIEEFDNLPANLEIKEDPNDKKHVILKTMGFKSTKMNVELGSQKNISVKYHNCLVHPVPLACVSVEFPNGRKYIAYLDTGLAGTFILTSDIVLDNKLPILPLQDFNFQGFCRIPVLNIGSAQIKDAVGFYHEQQWQFRIFNIPLYKHPAIILGRDFIKSFDYVKFDNVDQEVIFSKDEAFKPDNPRVWASYPFTEDPNRDNTIMVQMSINGKVFEVAFDSCGDKPGLRLNEKDWQIINQKSSIKRLRKSNYYSYQAGYVSFQKATVSEILVGEKILKDTDVLISDDPEHLSVISLGYFQDTIVVLDYVNNLMWIKK